MSGPERALLLDCAMLLMNEAGPGVALHLRARIEAVTQDGGVARLCLECDTTDGSHRRECSR